VRDWKALCKDYVAAFLLVATGWFQTRLENKTNKITQKSATNPKLQAEQYALDKSKKEREISLK
jgi:hypothetical protein